VSCGTKEKLKIVLDSYKGYDQASVVQNFGAPERIIDSNGSKVIEYHFTEQHFNLSPNNSLNSSINSPVNSALNNRNYLNASNGPNSTNLNFGLGSVQGYYSSSECRLTFTADARHIVKDWHYEGSLCERYATRENVNHQYIEDLARATDKAYGFQLAKASKGMKVTELYPESSAYKAGLTKGDLVTKINDLNVVNIPIEVAYHELNSNSQAKLIVLRKAEEIKLSVKKSDIPRIYSHKKSARKFLGFGSN
jgi:hypothetical protein